ncbi:MAG: hypothetical protein E7467_03245 [Ruminococcaceae bacterium]|nr:hypothetical protein [Oscillospiraceae bacterium]
MLCKLISIRLQGLLGKLSGKRGKGFLIVLALAFLYCFGTFGVLFYLMSNELAAILHATDYAWFYFALVGLVSFGLSFFFTAFTAKTELFESKDNELLLSLPIKPRTILLSRIALLLGMEYLFSFLVMIPCGIAWAQHAGLGFLPAYLLGCLSLPLLTSALASVVGWLLALLSSNARRKNLVTIVCSLVFLAIYFIVYSNMQDYVNQILSSYQQISDSMIGWGFLFHWLGIGIAEGEWGQLLAVISISLTVFTLGVWTISHRFLHIFSGNRSSHKKNTRELTYRCRSILRTLYKRELARFLSCPVYLLNCGLGMILMVAVAVYLAIQGNKLLVYLPLLPLTEAELAFAAALLLCTFGAMCCLTAASISLEGKTLWLLRSAPIDARKILLSKLLFHLSLTAPVLLAVSIVVSIVLRASAGSWVILLLIPQVGNFLCATLGLASNLRFPKFDWTNEAVPVKQSAPVGITMLTMMLLPIALIVGLFFLDIPLTIYMILATTLLVAPTFLCSLYLLRSGAKRFEHLSA